MSNKFDLHIHSTFSDGKYNVLELIAELKENDIKYFSITDHDNIDSIEYIKYLKLKDINYIPGVEISSYYKRMGIHILGYYIEDTSAMRKLLLKINQRRKKRMKEILKKIKKRDGIILTHDDFDELMHDNNIGKKHLGSILIRNNYGSTYKDVKDRYLTNLHCKISYRANIKKVCKAIKSSGGVPVLAHPKELELRYGVKLEDVIEDMVKKGIEGIEVYHSIHKKEDIERYLKIAKEYNLLTSGGSDFHNSDYHKLGRLSIDEMDYEKVSIIK